MISWMHVICWMHWFSVCNLLIDIHLFMLHMPACHSYICSGPCKGFHCLMKIALSFVLYVQWKCWRRDNLLMSKPRYTQSARCLRHFICWVRMRSYCLALHLAWIDISNSLLFWCAFQLCCRLLQCIVVTHHNADHWGMPECEDNLHQACSGPGASFLNDCGSSSSCQSTFAYCGIRSMMDDTDDNGTWGSLPLLWQLQQDCHLSTLCKCLHWHEVLAADSHPCYRLIQASLEGLLSTLETGMLTCQY